MLMYVFQELSQTQERSLMASSHMTSRTLSFEEDRANFVLEVPESSSEDEVVEVIVLSD